MNSMQVDGMSLEVTPFDGCGKCLVSVRRLSRKSDATSSPERQGRQNIDAVDLIDGHIIGWADDWEVSGATNPLDRPELGPWLRGERGPYAGIVGPSVDRVGRNMRDALNTGWAMKDSGRLLVTADHGIWDLTDPAEENLFTALAWGAQMELRAIQKRNSDAAINARLLGIPRNRNSYGYRFVRLVPNGKVDHVEIDPEAAAIIREVAQRILDDESGDVTVATEAVRLNRSGVLSPKDHRAVMYGRAPEGTPWGSKMLKSILISRATQGYLLHEGKPVLRSDGHPVQLADPLWDHATHKALIEKTAPKSERTNNRAPRGTWLLAGRAFCGVCDERLYAGQRNNGERRYQCNGRVRGLPQSQHCKPGPNMTAANLEKTVIAEFLTRWGTTPLLRRDFDPGTGYAVRIAELEADRERLLSDRNAGIYDRPADAERFRENFARMGAEIDELSALPDRPASMAWVPTGQTVADQWRDADDDAERRDILITYEIKVVLYPATPDYPRRVWVHDLDPVKEADAREAIARAEAEDAEAEDAYRSSIEDEYQPDDRDLSDAHTAPILWTGDDTEDPN